MARSWIENIVSEYYRKRQYHVIENFSYFAKTKGAKMPGWQELDLLAIKGQEVKLISCKRGMDPGQYQRLPMFFKMHVKALHKPEHRWLLRPKIQKILVIEYPRPRHKEMLETHGIEVVDLKDLLRDYIIILGKDLVKEGKEGNEPNFVTRTLKAVIKYGIGMPDIQAKASNKKRNIRLATKTAK